MSFNYLRAVAASIDKLITYNNPVVVKTIVPLTVTPSTITGVQLQQADFYVNAAGDFTINLPTATDILNSFPFEGVGNTISVRVIVQTGAMVMLSAGAGYTISGATAGTKFTSSFIMTFHIDGVIPSQVSCYV
jgi:hypothetical protein